jgi:hypothetical protein
MAQKITHLEKQAGRPGEAAFEPKENSLNGAEAVRSYISKSIFICTREQCNKRNSVEQQAVTANLLIYSIFYNLSRCNAKLACSSIMHH